MPRVPPEGVAQSRPKKVFFEKIGFVEGDSRTSKVYRKMQEEARAARERLSANRSGVLPQKVGLVHPPYNWDDVTESAKHREVLHVYRTASSLTKPYYARAHYTEGPNEENWAIQWCLWHCFRLSRTGPGSAKSAARRQLEMDGDDDDDDGSDGGDTVDGGGSSTSPDSWRQTQSSSTDSPASAAADRASNKSSSIHIRDTYWDPVRNL